jgi:hypothetical protein
MHAPPRIALRHLLMENSTSRRHPLNIARSKLAAVPQAIAMLDRSGEDVGDGFDAAMWMPGKAGKVVFGTIVPKVIQQEERIEVSGFAEAEGAVQLDSRPFSRGLGLSDALHRANGHGRLLNFE